MKIYSDDYRLTMTGKVWQIRAKLKALSCSSITLYQYIQDRKKKKL